MSPKLKNFRAFNGAPPPADKLDDLRRALDAGTPGEHESPRSVSPYLATVDGPPTMEEAAVPRALGS